MQYCDIDSYGGPAYSTTGRVWCNDHNLPATHCGPDGDSVVCDKFAEHSGCNCCPKNAWRRETPADWYKTGAKAELDRIGVEDEDVLITIVRRNGEYKLGIQIL